MRPNSMYSTTLPRHARWLAAAFAGVLALSACGGDDDDDTTAPGNGDQDLAGQTFTVAGVWSGSEQQNFEQVLAAFEERTGARATFQSTGDDIAAVIGPAIDAGSPPDVAMLPQPGLLRDLAGQGALRPIEEIAGSEIDENYADVWRELGTVDDTLYGVWIKAANKSTVWYRTDAFEAAGVEPPDDWDGLLEVSQALADAGETPWVISAGTGWTMTDWFENVYLRTAGPEMYDQLAEHEIPWTDPSVIEALELLGDKWSNTGWYAGQPLQITFDDMVVAAFENQDGAMMYEGDFVAGIIGNDTSAVVGEDALFFPFPSIDGSPESVVGGGDVAVLLTDNPAAQEFIRWLATPEPAEIWAPLGGFFSPNTNVSLDVYPDEISRELAEALTGAEVFRFDLSDLQPAAFGGTDGQGMWALLQDLFASPGDAQGIAEELEREAAAAFGN